MKQKFEESRIKILKIAESVAIYIIDDERERLQEAAAGKSLSCISYPVQTPGKIR